MSQSYFYWDQF